MSERSSKKHEFMMTFRVLGYQGNDGQWSAHCLETDLVGYGKSFNKAVDDLIELTTIQISFALTRKEMALLDRPASADIHEIYNRVFSEQIQSLPNKRSSNPKRRVTSIPVAPMRQGGSFSVASA